MSSHFVYNMCSREHSGLRKLNNIRVGALCVSCGNVAAIIPLPAHWRHTLHNNALTASGDSESCAAKYLHFPQVVQQNDKTESMLQRTRRTPIGMRAQIDGSTTPTL